jgi:hypothetical protein
MPKNSASQADLLKTERGEGERRGGGEGGCQKTTAARRRDLKFCWLEFAKNFEKFLRNLTALF